MSNFFVEEITHFIKVQWNFHHVELTLNILRRVINLKMIFRWFGDGHDSIPLEHIRQIPGVTGVVTTFMDIPAGELWPLDRLKAMKEKVNLHGLEVEVIESVNVHEDIKLGLPSRDKYIENYIETIKNLGEIGIKVLCYNFMPVLDWAKSNLEYKLEDGSTTLSYNHDTIMNIEPKNLARQFDAQSGGFELPGWEPERLKVMTETIEAYKSITTDMYWDNMKYFLDAVIPHAEKSDVKLAIHFDDPPWPLFGLPRVLSNAENVRKFLNLNPSPYNGLTFCTGSIGADKENDVAKMIREFSAMGRVHFAHIRNIKFETEKDFYESAHLSEKGSFDMYEIMKALSDTNFNGYVRPDHGRMIWGESGRPGYGLYDRALGAVYLGGIWEALQKSK